MSKLDYNLFLTQKMPFEIAEEETFKGLEDVLSDYLDNFGEFDKPKVTIKKLSNLRIELRFEYIEERIGEVIITKDNADYKSFEQTLDNFFNENKFIIIEKDETLRKYEETENESWKQQRDYESLLWARR